MESAIFLRDIGAGKTRRFENCASLYRKTLNGTVVYSVETYLQRCKEDRPMHPQPKDMDFMPVLLEE